MNRGREEQDEVRLLWCPEQKHFEMLKSVSDWLLVGQTQRGKQ